MDNKNSVRYVYKYIISAKGGQQRGEAKRRFQDLLRDTNPREIPSGLARRRRHRGFERQQEPRYKVASGYVVANVNVIKNQLAF